MQPHKKAKITFSPSNVDEYERAFRIEHDVAMGYRSPLVPRVQSVVDAMNEAFPVPSYIHVPFRRWIEHNHLAKFDCFQEPSWLCTCYKCVTFQLRAESDVCFYEKIKDEQERLVLAADVRGTLPVLPCSDTFRSAHVARVDCLQQPSVFCTCYKCACFQMHAETDAAFNERMKDDHEISSLAADTRGNLPPVFQASDRLQMLATVALDNATNAMPETPVIWEPVAVTVSNVCHIFTSFDMAAADGPTTPKLSTVSFDHDSDHGKEKAQRAWIRRQQMTPTFLRF